MLSKEETEKFHRLTEQLRRFQQYGAMGGRRRRFTLEMRNLRDLLYDLEMRYFSEMPPRVSGDYKTVYVPSSNIIKKSRKT